MQKLRTLLTGISKRSLFLRKFIRKAVYLFRLWRYKLRGFGRGIDDKLIVFSCFTGKKYADSPRAIYEYMVNSDEYKDYKFVWIFKEPENYSFLLNNRNTTIAKQASRDCEIAFATAKYWVCNHRAGVHRYPSKKQVFIQTWHGTPLKRLGLDIERANNEIYTLDELIDIFKIENLSKSPAIFDIEKLTHFNSEYIRAMAPEKFAEVAEPYIRQSVKKPETDTAAIAALLQQRCEKLTDIPEKVDFFDELPDYDIELFTHKKSKTDADSSREMLNILLPLLRDLPEWTDESILALLTGLSEKLEVKNAKVMWPLRIAVSGKAVTPGGAVEICRILGREETLARVEKALQKLG